MTRRTLFVITLLAAAAAVGGCQLVSGASSLDIIDDAGASSETGSGPDAADDAFRPPQDGAPELDAAVEADAAFVGCTVAEGGALTTCAPGGIPDVKNCVQYCATKGKCCAEDCKPFPTAQSVEAAQLKADTAASCMDPRAGDLSIETYTACSNSPLPASGMYFECCCR